jgi:hypothetical protein
LTHFPCLLFCVLFMAFRNFIFREMLQMLQDDFDKDVNSTEESFDVDGHANNTVEVVNSPILVAGFGHMFSPKRRPKTTSRLKFGDGAANFQHCMQNADWRGLWPLLLIPIGTFVVILGLVIAVAVLAHQGCHVKRTLRDVREIHEGIVALKNERIAICDRRIIRFEVDIQKMTSEVRQMSTENHERRKLVNLSGGSSGSGLGLAKVVGGSEKKHRRSSSIQSSTNCFSNQSSTNYPQSLTKTTSFGTLEVPPLPPFSPWSVPKLPARDFRQALGQVNPELGAIRKIIITQEEKKKELAMAIIGPKAGKKLVFTKSN